MNHMDWLGVQRLRLGPREAPPRWATLKRQKGKYGTLADEGPADRCRRDAGARPPASRSHRCLPLPPRLLPSRTPRAAPWPFDWDVGPQLPVSPRQRRAPDVRDAPRT